MHDSLHEEMRVVVPQPSRLTLAVTTTFNVGATLHISMICAFKGIAGVARGTVSIVSFTHV